MKKIIFQLTPLIFVFASTLFVAPNVMSKNNNSAKSHPTIGIALGAGGANGLAHIQMLEVLDELKIKPQCLAGSSIGAIIGALYASGKTAKDIRQLVEQFVISSDETLSKELLHEDTLRWIEFIDLELGEGGILSTEGFIAFLYEKISIKNFEELKIPLHVVTADLWSREQVILDSGPLLPALKASMAIPGVFAPVKLENRVLIDGGTVNPVPYDLLVDQCDFIIAIDVSGRRTKPDKLIPGYFELLFNSVDVMHKSIMQEKRQRIKPDIYITPDIVDIRALEFYRSKEIFKMGGPAKKSFQQKLESSLGLK